MLRRYCTTSVPSGRCGILLSGPRPCVKHWLLPWRMHGRRRRCRYRCKCSRKCRCRCWCGCVRVGVARGVGVGIGVGYTPHFIPTGGWGNWRPSSTGPAPSLMDGLLELEADAEQFYSRLASKCHDKSLLAVYGTLAERAKEKQALWPSKLPEAEPIGQVARAEGGPAIRNMFQEWIQEVCIPHQRAK